MQGPGYVAFDNGGLQGRRFLRQMHKIHHVSRQSHLGTQVQQHVQTRAVLDCIGNWRFG